MNVLEAINQVVKNLEKSPRQKKDESRIALSAAFPIVVDFTNGLRHVLLGTAFEHSVIAPFWDNLNLIFRFNGEEVCFEPREDGVYSVRRLPHGVEDRRVHMDAGETLSSAMLRYLVDLIKESTTKPV